MDMLSIERRNKRQKSAAVTMKVNCTAYTYGISAEPNRRICRVWNSPRIRQPWSGDPDDHAIPDVEISVVWFLLCAVPEQHIPQQLW